jgi:thiol-disulfide isomerase/thioredoxin
MRQWFLTSLICLPLTACGAAPTKPTTKAAAMVPATAGANYPAAPASAKAAPDFQATDASGRVWTLADTRAKPILVDFWATWCRPCLDAMPDLNNFYRKHGERLGLLGLNIDLQGWSVAKPMAERYALIYPYAIADPKLSKAFGARGYPFMALVYQGKIVKTLVGGRRVKELEKDLAPWL